MEFSQLFSIFSVIGALLFFSAGFSLALLKSGRAHEKAEAVLDQDWEAREAALREATARELAASQVVARESAARQAAASDAAMQRAECESLRAHLAACQAALQGGSNGHTHPDPVAQRVEALNAECARLRSDLNASATEIARLKSTLVNHEHRAGHVVSSLPPPVVDVARSGASFHGILDRLNKTKGIRAAVLGDALGLPVAALGEQAESLAGFGGFITQAASKAKDFLQLGSIRRIVIEDERLATVTACGIPGTDIFLATLTSGPGPEIARMVQVLNDVKSFMSQRSRA
jgi:predicted regulator of Ras-like GTPase activity (Roadblock/LC7/MglB family)/outer membrane murein-binding lipoprotein Lpp